MVTAPFCESALKPGHDRNDAVFDQAQHVGRIDVQNFGVAATFVTDETGLTPGHRLRGCPQRHQEFGKDRAGDRLAAGNERVAIRTAARGFDELGQ